MAQQFDVGVLPYLSKEQRRPITRIAAAEELAADCGLLSPELAAGHRVYFSCFNMIELDRTSFLIYRRCSAVRPVAHGNQEHGQALH